MTVLGSVGLVRLQTSLVWCQYRWAMEDVANTARTIHYRAKSERRMFILRMDPATNRIEVVAAERGLIGGETLIRAFWLPEGLAITSAATQVTAMPSGQMVPVSITVDAPTFQRTFWLTTTPSGRIQLHEEPTA
jgi:hypothetical protein